VFDEVIKEMITSRNISPFGYLALIGDTKMSIFLAYAEEETCTFDRVWTINFWDLSKLNIGKRIEVIDFSPSCEEFVAVMNTGELTVWSVKKQKFLRRVTSLKTFGTVTKLRTFANNAKCVACSKPENMLMIVDLQGEEQTIRIRP